MTVQTVGGRYLIYRKGIVAPSVLADRPIHNGEDATRLSFLVFNPGGLSLTIRKSTVITPGGQLNGIQVSGVNIILNTSVMHTMRVGDQVTITNSNCTPSINGTYAITSVPSDFSFGITVAAPVTASGNYALFTGSERLFQSLTLAGITASQELNVDHSGGNFILEVLAPAGPYAAGNAVDIYWRPL